ncbi:MAG: aminoacyl-tRNA hydrolase, partial [Chloroflexi bacterium]|nr:aminoacyl-tRNA hydrolase [Chloroflexota bacterium]
MNLIVGLGNPGRSYANNRHNLGFMCLSYFAKKHGLSFDKKQGQARTASGEVAGHKVILARPQTYMNASGEAVSYLVRKYKVSLEDLIVVHDDLDLPVGKIRIRRGGSAAGHKGIKSIIADLGSPDFVRIRVGIGQSGDSRLNENDVIDYVLGGFSEEE